MLVFKPFLATFSTSSGWETDKVKLDNFKTKIFGKSIQNPKNLGY